MIDQNHPNNQLPNELCSFFSELEIFKHLRKVQINGILSDIDKRISGYKRRMNALQTAPEQIPHMIRRALSNGIDANYVLMDSWFTLPPLVQAVTEQGLDVIGMVKEAKQCYQANGQRVLLKQLYQLAQPVQGFSVPFTVSWPTERLSR